MLENFKGDIGEEFASRKISSQATSFAARKSQWERSLIKITMGERLS